MAKTIYEMAVNYATEDGPNGKPFVVKTEKDAAIYGAEYVLDEIEEVLDLGKPPYLISAEQAYYKIKRRIKELKGE